MPDPNDPFAAYQTPAPAAGQPPSTVPGDPFAPYAKPVPAGGLPNVTNQDIKAGVKSAGRKALDYLPAIGATAGAMLAPEAVLPAMGMAALGGGIGEGVKQGALAATGSSDAPQSFGQAAQNVGESALEQGLFEGAGRAVAYPIQKIGSRLLSPSKMYGRELRPSTSLLPGEAEARVQTGLEQGVPVSQEGYRTAGSRATDLSNQMKAKVANTVSGNLPVINPLDIADRLDALATDSPYAKQALPERDVSGIQAAKREYLIKHGAKFDASGKMTTPPRMETPVDIAEEKSATYTANRQRYEAATKGGAAIDAARDASEKVLARGAKEELIALYPELRELGENAQEMFNLEDSLRQFVGRERNKNALGLRATLMGAGAVGGYALGGPAAGTGAGLLGLALSALDAPEVKSQIAIALHRASNMAIGRFAQQLPPSRAVPMAVRLGRAIYQANQPMQGPVQGP